MLATKKAFLVVMLFHLTNYASCSEGSTETNLVPFKDKYCEVENIEQKSLVEINNKPVISHIIEKFDSEKPVSVIHYDGNNKSYYVNFEIRRVYR